MDRFHDNRDLDFIADEYAASLQSRIPGGSKAPGTEVILSSHSEEVQPPYLDQ